MAAPAFQDKVKERLQATIAELIPQDQWDKLVSGAIKDFIEGGRDRYGTSTPPAINRLVHEELTRHALARIQAILADPEARVRAGLSAFDTKLEGELAALCDQRVVEIAQAAFKGMLAGHASYHASQMSFMLDQLVQRLKQGTL
jgi:hypothetical protein